MMNLTKAKKQFIREHPLGHLTISELRKVAKNEDVFVYGDKAQILQCLNIANQIQRLFVLNI